MKNKFLFPLLSALCSAGMLMLSEILTVKHNYSPLFVVLLLNIFGGITIFVLVKDKINSTKKIFTAHPLLLLGASLFSYVLSGLAAFYASSQIGSTKTSFTLQLETIFIVILAIIFLKEKITWKTVSAGLLIISGGALLQFHPEGISFTITDGIALLAPLFFSIGIMFNTQLLKYHDAVAVTAIGQLIAAAVLCLAIPWMAMPITAFSLMLAILMALLEGFAWLFYNKGLATAGASITTIIFGTIPFFTIMLSLLFNYIAKDFFIIPENILFVASGGILIFIGIIVISKSNP